MEPIKINVGTLPIGNNPAPFQTERAIADKLTEEQYEELYNANLYRDIEITYSRAYGWPGNEHTFYSYVEDFLSYVK